MAWLRTRGRREVVGGAAILIVVIAVVSAVVVVFATRSDHKAARPCPKCTLRPAVVTMPTWSGYVALGPPGKPVAYSNVTGTWTVPAAACVRRQGHTVSAVWLGMGGYNSRAQEEVGTDSNCDASGKPVYFAWFEIVPYHAYQTFPDIQEKVFPGDTITGSVKIISPVSVQLQVRNRTRGWTFSRAITFGQADRSTAEWGVTAPNVCIQSTCYPGSLANFHQVTMRNISAVAHGVTETLANPNWKVIPVRLVPGKIYVPTLSTDGTANWSIASPIVQAASRAGANPGPVTSHGTRFTMTWVRVAKPGL